MLTACYTCASSAVRADKLLADQVQRNCACATRPPPHRASPPAALARASGGAVAFTGFWWVVLVVFDGVGG